MKNKSATVFWIGLKVITNRQRQRASLWIKGKGLFIAKYGALALIAYGLLVLSAVWVAALLSGYSPAQSRLYFLNETQYQGALKEVEGYTNKRDDSMLKRKDKELAELRAAMQYEHYKVVRVELEPEEPKGNDTHEHLKNHSSREVLLWDKGNATLNIDLTLGHAFEMNSPVFVGMGGQYQSTQKQYQGLPVSAQKAYQWYVNERFEKSLKDKLMKAALIGWIAMLVVAAVIFYAFIFMGYGVILLYEAVSERIKKGLQVVKECGLDAYEEELAKKEKEVMEKATAHQIKSEQPSRPKSL